MNTRIMLTKKGFLRRAAVLSVLIFASFVNNFTFVYAAGDSAAVGGKLQTNRVCMMNNQLMGADQIPVPVNGKKYYGCCAGCAASLQNNPQIRQATDPYSGETVDKADAFIVLKSEDAKEVQYFKSEENYKEYQKLSSSPNMSRAN